MSIWLGWPVLVVLQSSPAFVLLSMGNLGRGLGERLVLSLVLSGPIAALAHLLQLQFGVSPAGSWIALIVFDAIAIGWLALRLRQTGRVAPPASGPRFTWKLLLLLTVILGAYHQSTAVYSRPTPSGELALVRSLQRDTLFHVGMVRAVEVRYPPSLLSFGGREVGYHVGYHLQLASWCRLTGMDALDAVLRFGAGLQIALLVLTVYGLGWRLSRGIRSGAAWWSACLILGGGLGFGFFFVETVDWWSLVFMDAALVSILLVNPLLPALPLLFAGLILTHDELDERQGADAGGVATPDPEAARRSALRLLVIAICSGWLLLVKMFVGAQWLASVMMAALVRRPSRTLVRVGLAAAIGAVPALTHTLVAASDSNTGIGLKPFEIMRYSAEKLGWSSAVENLASVGRFSGEGVDWLFAVGFLAFWMVGFLGLRVLAAPEILRSLLSSNPLLRILAWFAVMGFPLTLLLRIAPSEAVGDSRLEAQNDAIWFATQSGLVWWLFLAVLVAESMGRWGPRRRILAAVLIGLLVLPAPVQHFRYLRDAGVDLVGRERLSAAEAARELSADDELWLESPDRAHPSLLAYWAGRRVVYDPYVGYDYMFVGRRETEWRRHAVAYFWRSHDPAFQSWFLRELGIAWLWSHDDGALVGIQDSLRREHSTEAVSLWRVGDDPANDPTAIRVPRRVPMSRAGALHLGEGFSAPVGSPARRSVAPGVSAIVYVPHPAGRSRLTLDASSGSGGVLRIDNGASATSLGSERQAVVFDGIDFPEPGFSELTLSWDGTSPLEVFSLMFGRLDGDATGRSP